MSPRSMPHATAAWPRSRRLPGSRATATPAASSRPSRYLRDNLKYGLGDREIAGLRRFHELAAEQGLVPGLRDLKFF